MNWLAFVEVALNDLSTVERAVATVAGVLLVAGTLWLARREFERHDSRLVNVAALFGSVTALAAVAVALVVVWNVETDVQMRLRELEVQARLLGRVALTIGFLVAVYIATGVLDRSIEGFMKRRDGITDHQAEVTFRIVQISLYVLGVIMVLGFWSVNLSGLLIGAGFAGIVLGMAARQTIGAVIAGFVLMFSRPFEIGDWVKIGDKDGIITDITIVNTRMQTFDGEYVMLPNDYVGSNEVVNRSRKGRLRIHVEVGVDYGTDVDEAMAVAKDAMDDVEDILSVPRPQVVLKEFGDSGVILDLRFWIDKPSARRRWRAQTSVISAVKAALDDAGIKIPFPQREVSGRAETGGFRVREQPPGDGESEPDDASATEAAVDGDAESAVDQVDDEATESATEDESTEEEDSTDENDSATESGGEETVEVMDEEDIEEEAEEAEADGGATEEADEDTSGESGEGSESQADAATNDDAADDEATDGEPAADEPEGEDVDTAEPSSDATEAADEAGGEEEAKPESAVERVEEQDD